jgi:drug/metabolite transporter (DMT)-like permease
MEAKGAAFFLGGMIACMVIAQVVLKHAGMQVVEYPDTFRAIVLSPFVWIGLAISALALLLWLLTLRSLPLAAAYPWTALIYLFTPLASVVLFDDTLSASYLFGMVGIVGGIWLTAGGVASK